MKEKREKETEKPKYVRMRESNIKYSLERNFGKIRVLKEEVCGSKKILSLASLISIKHEKEREREREREKKRRKEYSRTELLLSIFDLIR